LFTHMCLCSPRSINWYRRKLGAKQALRATHVCVCGIAALAGVWLKATAMEISAALWVLVALEGLYSFSFQPTHLTQCNRLDQP